jgi:histidinol-phosphate phosphatase family protein
VMVRQNRAVFFDRDGTLAPDVPYCSRAEDFVLFGEAPQSIKLLNEAGFKVIVITNQSGIARGYFSERTLSAIHAKMCREFEESGARIDAIYYCPHHPEDDCECRKPKTMLFEKAVTDFGIDVEGSFVIGDTQMDISAGKAMGCKSVLVARGPVGPQLNIDHADFMAPNLMEAAQYCLEQARLAVNMTIKG